MPSRPYNHTLALLPPLPRPNRKSSNSQRSAWQVRELFSSGLLMEVAVYDNVSGGTITSSAEAEVTQTGNKDGVVENPVEDEFEPDENGKIDKDSPENNEILPAVPSVPVASEYEPYIGKEFDSEAAAHAFYNAYAIRAGFVVRVSKLSRSTRDGSVIGRQLVCNREGFRMAYKHGDRTVRQKAETRVGCRAMIFVRKGGNGKWSVTRFVKEHTHPLTPGMGRIDTINSQYPCEHDRIKELTRQLTLEKKRSATYKRHLELILEEIEEHNENLSKKIQNIVTTVKETENHKP